MKNNIVQKNIPTDWRQANLGEIFEFKNGVNSEGTNFGSGIRFINIMEVINNDFLKAHNIPGRITLDQKNIDNNLVKYGDILFNRTSETPEEVGMTSVYLDDEPVVFGGFVIRAREKEKVLSDEYKKYCFSSQKIRKEIVRRCQGVVRGNIGQRDLEKVPFDFPTIAEQNRIAMMLKIWDEEIEKLVKKIKAKKNSKKSLLQQLLSGKKRLPGFSDTWKKANLGDILKERKERDVESNDLSLFSLTIENGVCPKSARYDRSFLVKSDEKSYKKSYKNDIVYNPANLRFGAIAQNKNDKPVLLSPIYQVLYLKNEKENNIDFIGHLLTWNRQVRKMSAYAEGTLIERMEVKIDSFKIISIEIPSFEEQSAIANILTIAEKEIVLLEKKLAIIKGQKKFLLNNLITGAIRTPEK